MKIRHWNYWLIVLNLLALNAYAMAAATAGHEFHSPLQSRSMMNPVMHDCVMPCCHGKHDSTQRDQQLSQCDCKTNLCSAVQMQSVAVTIILLSRNVSSNVDAMSTTIPVQNPVARLLRPPIQ